LTYKTDNLAEFQTLTRFAYYIKKHVCGIIIAVSSYKLLFICGLPICLFAFSVGWLCIHPVLCFLLPALELSEVIQRQIFGRRVSNEGAVMRRSTAGTVGSNLATDIDVCLL
jgi:hypothetical protein